MGQRRQSVSISVIQLNKRKPALTFVLITLMLDVLGFGLLIPVAPKLVQGLLPAGSGDGAAAYAVALLASIYALMQLIFSPILGALSDRFGRRPVLLTAIFGSGLDYFALALSPNLWFLYLTRALNGISGASMTVCNAYIADITEPDKRAGAFGLVGAAFGVGFILGPLMGGWLGSYDIHYPFYAAGALSLLNWLYGLFVLPESLPPEKRNTFSLKRANPIGAFIQLGKYPLVAGMAGSLFLLNLAMFGLHTTWVLYTSYRYHWEPWQVGLSLAFVGLGAAVVQGGLARKIIPALGERNSLLLGLGVGVLAYIGYGAATQGWMIYAIVCVASIGGIAQPAGQAIITRTVGPREQGAVQGSLAGLQSIANIIGPMLASVVFAYFISDKAPFVMPGASFFLGAILAALGLVVAAYATRGHK